MSESESETTGTSPMPPPDTAARRGAPEMRNTFATRGVLVALVGIAVAIRVNNALRYRTRMGFDAVENVEYVQRLLGSWALPAPDASWATSHPPLFYYLSAAIGRVLSLFDATTALTWVIPLASSATGLLAVWAVYRLVRSADTASPRQGWIAAALLLYAPVHIYMSAMFSEEILAATWSSLAVAAAAVFVADDAKASDDHASDDEADAAKTPASAWQRAALIGALAGLAWLTKLSGVLVMLAIATGWGLTALRRGELRRMIGPLCALVVTATVLGGWFYARNLVSYGYLYPQDLEVHAIMFEMPPGDRGVLDYLRFPLATFSDPQLLHPDLLQSVWGSTYATLWFDGHRHFLPSSLAASRAGTTLLLLAIVPTLAFFVGVARAVARWWRAPEVRDAVLLALLAFTGAGYVAFTWSNPWFATLKGSYLLGAGVPFAYYASETLDRWISSGGLTGRLVAVALGALFIAVTLVFTIGLAFTKLDATGLPWRTIG